MHPRERHCLLYSIDAEIPKLDVAGSSPVSRSMFSTGYSPPTSAKADFDP